MAESRIPVDLLNPGQVFACLGIMEAVGVLLGDVAAVFDWNNRETAAMFRISAAGDEKPVERIMQFLDEAKIVTRVPARSLNAHKWKESWGENPAIDSPNTPFPFPDPDSPATLPAILRDGTGTEIAIDYWGDGTRRDNVKFWAGAGGYPGAAILRDALAHVRGKVRQHANDPFALSAAQSSSFRFDWRRDYVPIQVGFSPNKHPKGTIAMKGFPLVEILAAIGVTNARPVRTNKLKYQYGVLGGQYPVDAAFVRAALGSVEPPIPGQPFRCFTMRLDWPGQENQARCITQVTEISN